MPHNDLTCTICLAHLARPVEVLSDAYRFSCPRCGAFILTGTADAVHMSRAIPADHPDIARLGHFIRRMQRTEECPLLNSSSVQQILESGEFPSPFEQADNLLRFVAERVAGPGETMSVNENHQFAIGARTPAGVFFLLKGLLERGLLYGNLALSGGAVSPTLEGWQRHEDLRRGISKSRQAFMAMQFNDSDLDHIVERHFRKAVGRAGFSLFRLNDELKAGSIDDRLRVEIQNSRFMIADLSHANNGAYWEAGYAEGLQKPVIYTCREDAFSRIHFDTSHLLTIKWRPGNEEDAAERLTAAIRATLPDAKRTDD